MVYKASMLLVALALWPSMAHASDFRCFRSVGRKTAIQFQLTFSDKAKDPDSVRYRKGSAPILVDRVSESVIEEGIDGRPSMTMILLKERGSAGGRYEMDVQGANIYGMEYLRKDGKRFSFEDDPDSYGDSACNWK
ncbi:MAG: hypothetical protein AAB214_11350 [Fibrobacterota bacterium]